MKHLAYIVALLVTFIGTIGTSTLFFAWKMDSASFVAFMAGSVAIVGIFAIWESDTLD